jgi:hypothetical protein
MSASVIGAGAGAGADAAAGGRCQAGDEAGEVACQAAELETAAVPNARKTATCAKRLQKFDPNIRAGLLWA